jgi:hypothetical protein
VGPAAGGAGPADAPPAGTADSAEADGQLPLALQLSAAGVSPLSSDAWTDCAKPRRLSYGTVAKPGLLGPAAAGQAPVPAPHSGGDAAAAAALATPAPLLVGPGVQAGHQDQDPGAGPGGVPQSSFLALKQRFAKLHTGQGGSAH